MKTALASLHRSWMLTVSMACLIGALSMVCAVGFYSSCGGMKNASR